MTSVARIHITGGQGSGKSTLASRLASSTGLPVHELDRIARVGGGNGPERPPSERAALVADIAADDRWITEGVHLGWTDPLLERAQVILWLDHLTPVSASGRVVHRFLSGAMAEVRTRRGRDRFTRVGDYLRHTRELADALRQARVTTDPDRFAGVLAPYGAKVIRCRTSADVAAFVDSLDAAATGIPMTSPGALPGPGALPAAGRAPVEAGR